MLVLSSKQNKVYDQIKNSTPNTSVIASKCLFVGCFQKAAPS